MNKILYILFFATLLACETPFYPDIQNENQVVVNSFFGPNEPIEVNISRSNFILDPQELVPISQATVTVRDTDGFIETLLEDDDGNYASTFVPEIDTEYILSIQADGYSEVISSDIIPEAVSVQSFSVETELSDVNLGEAGYRAILTFDDPETIENYYGVEVVIVAEGSTDIFNGEIGYLLVEDPDVGLSGNVDINLGDPSAVEGDPIIFLNDAQFDGQSRSLEFFIIPTVDLSADTPYEVYIVLKSVSEDYYNYLWTRAFQKNIEESGTLSEPVQVTNNIQNGLGVFAGYSFDYLKAK